MRTRIRFLALLFGALAFGQASARDNDSGEWVPCAREGQTCHVPGLAQVRFGANNQFAVKNVDGRVECDTSVFGDPSRRQSKYCEYRLGWDRNLPRPDRDDRERGWEDCAREGEVCRFRGARTVRFGAEGAYNFRREVGQIECSIDEFGDPVYGVRKKCQVRNEPDRPGYGGRPDDHLPGGVGIAGGDRPDFGRPSNRWAYCADEGKTCTTSMPTVIRYGVPGNYHYRQVSGTVRCDSRLFGDPQPGVQKTCEINTVPVNRAVSRQPDADEIPPLDDRFWTECARESQECRFRGQAHVRFGANGLFRVMPARDGLGCDTHSFGGDPTPNVRKTCSVYRP
ncbi:hypothetical protein [Hydrogenophaga sp. RWCD_12]|uniref:hypothetical protein n=1 Tax=Hydrogenophaga sp. RWCD_12 TaxID=3391190 RepID=UPI00398502B5